MNLHVCEPTRRWGLASAISVAAMVFIAVGLPSLPVTAAEIEVDAPSSVDVGEVVAVASTVTLDGEPVVDAELALSFLGQIAGESGWIAVATATTDETGRATFEYEQRALDGGRMRVEYFGPDGQENVEFTLTVVDGPQLVRSDAGADLPIFGVGWLIVLLGIVWVLMVLAARGLLLIGGGGGDDDGSSKPVRLVPRLAVGFIVFTAVGMFVVLLTKPQSHANLDPTTPFDRMPQAVVGVEYDYAGLGDRSWAPERGDLSADQLYVQVGCSSCHAPRGDGGIIGPAISGEDLPSSYEDFSDEVRSGPKGMPAYSYSALSEDEAAKIYEYFKIHATGHD
jgi:hypothetical protein